MLAMTNDKEAKEKERYLCVSNGFEIWCLDLKKYSTMNASVHLKIPSLNLMGQKLPASVGLFRLGSDAYMIGGQMLPGSVKESIRNRFNLRGDRNPQGGNKLYKTHYMTKGVKGSSRCAYRLSLLAADDDDKAAKLLSILNPCGEIEELKKPKVWPIVEKVGE